MRFDLKLFENLTPEDFSENFFEKHPCFGKTTINTDVNFDDIFQAAFNAHLQHDARFTRSDALGGEISPKELDARIENENIKNHADWFRKLFEEEKVSLLINNASNYISSLTSPLNALGSMLEGNIYDYCIATPPEAAASNIHYDSLDVFSFNIAGEKNWELFEPITPLPSGHITMEEIGSDLSRLQLRLEATLGPGDAIYIPRGWIHQVKNKSRSPSLQIAVAYTPDTWIGLFSNMLRYAYGRLTTSQQLRRSITLTDLKGLTGQMELKRIRTEFTQYFLEAIDNGLDTNLDFIHNPIQNMRLRNEAQASHDLAQDASVRLVPSGAQFLVREYNATGFLSLTADGGEFFYLPLDFWLVLRKSKGLTPSEIAARSGFSMEELDGFLRILVGKLGIYKFE